MTLSRCSPNRPPPSEADLDEVTSLLTLAGLPASGDERRLLATGMALHRQQLASLWDLADTRYGEPALIFQAAPALARWGVSQGSP